MKTPNKFAHMADGTVIVMLERKDGTVLPCFVDAADWEKVRTHRWCATKQQGLTHYVITNVRKPDEKAVSLLMHRLLLPEAEQVDHRDGNGLNNRRTNLRTSTHQQNMRNRRKPVDGVTSQYKGVHWFKRTAKWRASIRINDKPKHLGYFTSEIDAARAYDAAAVQYHGEFARLNYSQQKAA